MTSGAQPSSPFIAVSFDVHKALFNLSVCAWQAEPGADLVHFHWSE